MPVTTVDESVLEAIKVHAGNACIGGTSQVRERKARLGSLSVDQLVGQLGEFALARWLGDERQYFSRRQERDRNPLEGDDGHDFGTLPLDVKCSLMRYSSDPQNYRLPVRPKERHPGWKYIAAFVDQLHPPTRVYLSGWIDDQSLPDIETVGTFKGAHVVPVPELFPMNTLRL